MRFKIIFATFIFGFFTSLLERAAFAQTKELDVSVEGFCKSYQNESDFLINLEKEILKQNEKRILLVQLMKQNKAQGCQNVLNDYLDRHEQDDVNKRPSHFKAYLLLAYSADLKIAKKIIENEIKQGRLLQWLDVIEQTNHEAYFKTLSRWVFNVADMLRDHSGAQLVDLKFYGSNILQDEDVKTPETIPIWNPIIINKYMTEIVSQKRILSQSDFANLNIIFAASNQSYREIFLNQMSAVVALAQVNWIESFRVEPSLVEFRLFPIMKKVGGGLMKKELIWLSNHHDNFKIRSVAQNTLEKLNASPVLFQ